MYGRERNSRSILFLDRHFLLTRECRIGAVRARLVLFVGCRTRMSRTFSLVIVHAIDGAMVLNDVLTILGAVFRTLYLTALSAASVPS
jgi:hypothetical protein